MFGIINTADAGWASPATGTAVTAGIVLLVVLVLIERRAAQPIMPLRLFASRRRAGAYVARFLYLGAMIAFFFFTTQFLQEVLGFDPLQAGMGWISTLYLFAGTSCNNSSKQDFASSSILITCCFNSFLDSCEKEMRSSISCPILRALVIILPVIRPASASRPGA